MSEGGRLGVGTGRQIWAAGRVVGQVRGDVFVKSVTGSRHQLRRPPAWALDVQSLADAEKAGARWVEIRDRDTGAAYRASIEAIRRHGFQFDRGAGRQVALPLERWQVRRAGELAPEQMALF